MAHIKKAIKKVSQKLVSPYMKAYQRRKAIKAKEMEIFKQKAGYLTAEQKRQKKASDRSHYMNF